jgi:hypothetical protein
MSTHKQNESCSCGTCDAVERVRNMTQDLLTAGSRPDEVAYALVSVATEMGLAVSDDPLAIYPVLLAAIAQQTVQKMGDDNSDVSTYEAGPSAGEIIH